MLTSRKNPLASLLRTTFLVEYFLEKKKKKTTLTRLILYCNKVQVGKDQEKAQSEKKIPTPKTEVGKTKVQVGKDQEKEQSEKKMPTSKTEVGKNQTNNQVLMP